MFKNLIELVKDRVLIINGSTLLALEFIGNLDVVMKFGITILVLVYTAIKVVDMYHRAKHNGLIRKALSDKIFKKLQGIKNRKKNRNKNN